VTAKGAAANPAVGAAVTLLSQRTGLPHDATVLAWHVHRDGLDVTALVAVDAAVAAELADQRLWVTVAGHGRPLTVFSGVARVAAPGQLSMTGISPVVRERRRGAPRTPTSVRVRLRSSGRGERLLDALDLGRDAVRVAIDAPGQVLEGERVQVRVDLGDGDLVSADGEVVRVDEPAGYAVVRFVRLPRDQAGRIDRYVLFRLARGR
jgi:hypothetical protein